MTQSTAQGLASLAARVTNPEDRETYAGLVSYFRSLPDHDELFHLVELLGLLTLLGQRVPDALADAMTELRQLTERAGAYYGEIDERLAGLPGAITAGVDVGRIAKDMGEAFRQQFAATGLEISAAQLRNSSSEMTALSGHISACVQPATLEYKALADSIAAGVSKLTAASEQLNSQRLSSEVQPRVREQSGALLWHGLLLLVMLLIGGLCGGVFEKRQTTDALLNVETQVERIQTPVASAVAAPRGVIARKR